MIQLEECKQKLAHFKRTSSLKYGLIRIGIFGSVARKENTENSDIDIVVELEKPSSRVEALNNSGYHIFYRVW